MHKDTTINIVGVLVLLVVVGLGFFLYKKVEAPTKSLPDTLNTVADGATSASVAAKPDDSAALPSEITSNQTKTMDHVTIDTNFGKIVLELYPKDAPKAAENFKTLAGKGFYDNLIFHRVIQGFMIQGGDPQGSGMGGPGYKFADELDPNTPSAKAGYKKGILAMANSGPNTNGSQFFIMLEHYPLPHNYTIFGRVVSGQEVVDAIGKTKTGANDRPVIPVVMKSVTVGE